MLYADAKRSRGSSKEEEEIGRGRVASGRGRVFSSQHLLAALYA